MKITFVIGALCLLSIPSTVFACSCATGDPAMEFNSAKMVFIGRMVRGTEKLSVKDPKGKARSIEAGKVRFTVEEFFKGTGPDEVTIEIASMDGTSCGPYGLKRGERYIVYAYRSEEKEEILYSGVCTRTTPVGSKYAKEDLDFLRNLPPPGTGGNLRGSIWADLRAGGATPLPNVRVKIRSADDQVINALTDKDGDFEVNQLKPGKYKVEPEFPSNYMSERSSTEVNVDDRGTASVGFEAYLDGRISGRVVDKEGNGFNSIFLHLVEGKKTIYGHAKGEEGAFEVAGVPPGEYLLSIEMQNADYKKNANYYYPGTFDREKAAVLRVGLGEKVEGLEFRLPDGFSVCTVEGDVVWKDGTPAGEVEVILLCPRSTAPNGSVIEFGATSVRTDAQGHFRLEGLSGETYWIEARTSREDEKEGTVELHSPSRKLSLTESVKNLKLVLSKNGVGEGCPSSVPEDPPGKPNVP